MRILALIPPGTNARAIYLDLLRGAQVAGHAVLHEDVSAYVADHQRAMRETKGSISEELRRMRSFFAAYIAGVVRRHRCDMVFTLWVDPLMLMPWTRRGDRLVSALEVMGVPAVHYWLDAPFWAYSGALLPIFDRRRFTSPMHVHAVNNSGTAAEMRTVLNMQSVVTAPFGVDPATFRPWPEVERDFELAINTGPGDPPPTPRMVAELGSGAPDIAGIRREQAERALPKLIAVITGADAPPAGGAARTVAERWLREQVADPDRPMLDKFRAALTGVEGGDGCEQRLLRAENSPVLWGRATALVRSVDSWQRAFTTAYLSRRFRAVLIGAGAAQMLRNGWPVRGPVSGPVPYHELSAWYSRARGALSVMRYQDDVGMNIKGLEAAASGCLVLEKSRLGLLDRFTPDDEVIAFTRPDEAADRFADLLRNPDRLAAIAEAGRVRTLREHTWEVRAGRLVAMAGERAVGRPAA